LAARKRVPQASIVEAALASHLSPDGAERLEGALARRLDRMTRQRRLGVGSPEPRKLADEVSRDVETAASAGEPNAPTAATLNLESSKIFSFGTPL
jgi:hypothetical protein